MKDLSVYDNLSSSGPICLSLLVYSIYSRDVNMPMNWYSCMQVIFIAKGVKDGYGFSVMVSELIEALLNVTELWLGQSLAVRFGGGIPIRMAEKTHLICVFNGGLDDCEKRSSIMNVRVVIIHWCVSR